MNDHLAAVEIAEVLKADADLLELIPHIFPEQSGAVTSRPSLSISGTFEPFGVRRRGELVFELRSRIADEEAAGEDGHDGQFELLWAKLIGAEATTNAGFQANLATAKAAIATALAERGHIALIDYGPARDALAADADGEDLRTVLRLGFAFTFTPTV